MVSLVALLFVKNTHLPLLLQNILPSLQVPEFIKRSVRSIFHLILMGYSIFRLALFLARSVLVIDAVVQMKVP